MNDCTNIEKCLETLTLDQVPTPDFHFTEIPFLDSDSILSVPMRAVIKDESSTLALSIPHNSNQLNDCCEVTKEIIEEKDMGVLGLQIDMTVAKKMYLAFKKIFEGPADSEIDEYIIQR